MAHLNPLPLPPDIISATVDCTSSCGLTFHTLQSGDPTHPLVLFCHGYPELAYSWRHILPAIARAGYFCVAPDQRGYGRTTGWESRAADYASVDLAQFTMPHLARDLVCLAYRLGHPTVACIVGHDFGAVVAASAALIRPDVFQASVHLSHPYHRPPEPPLGEGEAGDGKVDIQAELAKLEPPRKHYKWDNSKDGAAEEWARPRQGLKEFLRGYFHLKSGAWEGNAPRQLEGWNAKALSVMPTYYVMEKDATMPETIAKGMEGENARKTEAWLSEEELDVYVKEWGRTGFLGALSWYRAQTEGISNWEMTLFGGKKIEVPCAFVSGKVDWGNYQQPGALDEYENPKAVTKGCFRGMKLVEGAGHWVQQEKPEEVIEELSKFLKSL